MEISYFHFTLTFHFVLGTAVSVLGRPTSSAVTVSKLSRSCWKTMALGLGLDVSLKNVFIITVPLLISWARYRGLEYIIKHYRWVFVCLFLMPISVVYDVYMFIRNWIVFKLNSAPKQHANKVKDVQQQVSFSFSLNLCNSWVYSQCIITSQYLHIKLRGGENWYMVKIGLTYAS